MKEKIRNLIFTYVNNNKHADYYFLKELYNILISGYGNNGLKGVTIIYEKKRGISDFENSLIGINLNYIEEELMKTRSYSDIKSNLYLFNILVVLVFVHEFNHFRQVIKYKKSINSEYFLDKLFTNSFFMVCASNADLINDINNTNYEGDLAVDKFYNEYHDCLVAERMAQIDAYRFIVEIICSMQKELKQVYYYFLYEYYSYKLKDYSLCEDIVISPFDKILLYMEDNSSLNEDSISSLECEEDIDFNIIDEYTVDNRFRYGLPITMKEYNDTLDFMRVMYVLSDESYGVVKTKKRYKK